MVRLRPVRVPPQLPPWHWIPTEVKNDGGVDPSPTSNPSEIDIGNLLRTNPLPVRYGKFFKVTGVILHIEQVSGYTYVCYGVSYGPIKAITNIRFGDEPEKTAANLGITTEIKLGTKNQTKSILITNVLWTTRIPGIAAVFVKFPSVMEVNPLDFRCDGEGLYVLDARNDPTLVTKYYRTNPALMIADILTSKRYGAKLDINKINWDVLAVTADWCDYQIAPSIPRYETHYSLDKQEQVKSVVENMRAHAQLFLVYDNGKYLILYDGLKTASGITFTDVGADSNIKTAFPLRERPSSDISTHVVVDFFNHATLLDDSIEIFHPGIDTGAVEQITKTYNLSATPSKQQALRIGKYLYNAGILRDKEITIVSDGTASQLLPGAIVTVTSSQINVTAEEVLINNISISEDLSITMQGTFYDPDVYSDVIAEFADSLIPSYQAPPPGVPVQLWASHIAGGGIKLQWIPPKEAMRFEIRYGYKDSYGEFSADTWESANYIDMTAAHSFIFYPPYNFAPGLYGTPATWRFFVKSIDYNNAYSLTAAYADMSVIPEAGLVPSLKYFGLPEFYTNPEIYIQTVSDTTLAIHEGFSTNRNRFMFTRNISPQQIDDEIAWNGFTSLQEWYDELDLVRTKGVGQWAPITPNIFASWNATGGYYSGSMYRLFEHRVWPTRPAYSTLPSHGYTINPNAIARAEFTISGSVGPTSTANRLYGNNKVSLILSTNDSHLQKIVESEPGTSALAYWMRTRIPFMIQSSTITTNASGVAVLNFAALPDVACLPSVKLTVLNASNRNAVVTARSASSISIKTFTANTGAAIGATDVNVEIWDAGEGGMVSFVTT